MVKQISNFAQNISKSIEKRNTDLFLSYFDISVVEIYYLKNFFLNYTKDSVKRCNYQLNNITASSFELIIEIIYKLNYTEKIKFINTYSIDKILKITKTVYECVTGHINVYTSTKQKSKILYNLNNIDTGKVEYSLSNYNCLMEIQSKTKEPKYDSCFSRALSGSIRYRVSNPIIDCAIVLSNILSPRLQRLIFFQSYSNKFDILKSANQNFGIMFKHKSYDNYYKVKKNFPFRELSLEPAHNNFDELLFLFLKGANRPIDIMCSEISPLYAAWFFLSDLTEKQQFVISLPFHYMNYVKIFNSNYLIDVNTITCINNKRVYKSYNKMTGINTSQYYINQNGYTNIEYNDYINWKNYSKEHLKCFNFDCNYKPWDVVSIKDSKKLPTIFSKNKSQKELVKQVYNNAYILPQSSNTWAKYVHQSIIVGYPQCYIQQGLNDSRLFNYAKIITSENNLLIEINKLKDDSIFCLPYQIMTIRQILDYRIGFQKEKMLLYYCVIKHNNWIKNGYVVITSTNSYVCYKSKDDSIKIMSTHGNNNKITGDIYIIWNDKEHYSLWNGYKLLTQKFIIQLLK